MTDQRQHVRRWQQPQSPSTGSGVNLPSIPLGESSGALYIERMFFLRWCINQSVHYLRLYRSLYSNRL